MGLSRSSAALTTLLIALFGGSPLSAIAVPQIVGHKGGNIWGPENTLSSFRKCVAHGYGIELDIHQCKSGELVVCHDEDVARTTNGTGLIKDMTWEQLGKLSAGKLAGPDFANEKLPLLSQVLEAVDGKVLLNIEIKNTPIKYPGIEEALVKLLSTYKAPGKILISSFDHEALHTVHKLAPQYKLGFLDSAVPYDLPAYAKAIGAASWNPYFGDARADVVELAHKHGISVNVWTLDKPEDWRKAIDMNVDSIITDDPESLEHFMSGAK